MFPLYLFLYFWKSIIPVAGEGLLREIDVLRAGDFVAQEELVIVGES